MKFATKFDVFQRVRIAEIAIPATIVQIKYDGLSIFYNVEYWWNGDIKSVWLFERELTEERKCA